MTIEHFSDIDWSRDPVDETEASVRRAFLYALAEEKSRFGGPYFGFLALESLTMDSQPIAADLGNAIADWKQRADARRQLSWQQDCEDIFTRISGGRGPSTVLDIR